MLRTLVALDADLASSIALRYACRMVGALLARRYSVGTCQYMVRTNCLRPASTAVSRSCPASSAP